MQRLSYRMSQDGNTQFRNGQHREAAEMKDKAEDPRIRRARLAGQEVIPKVATVAEMVADPTTWLRTSASRSDVNG